MLDIQTITDEDRIDLLSQVMGSISQVASTFTDEDWDRPTDLPGWTVKDNLSHLASFEATAIGRPRADQSIDVSRLAHVTNDFQAINEREVEVRRPLGGEQVLAEYVEVATQRLTELPTLDQSADIDASVTPLGFTMPMRDFLAIRLADHFYHEQDMRRATGNPGGLDGAVATAIFERMVQLGLPKVIGKTAQVPEGASVAFHVDGARSFAIAVRDGRAAFQDDVTSVTTSITTDLEAFLCLIGGRWTPATVLAEGRVKVEGDDAIATRVLDSMVLVP